MVILGWGIPQISEAGILSFLVKLVSGGESEVEEAASPLTEIEAAFVSSALGAVRRGSEPADPAESGALSIIQADALVAPLNPIGTLSPPEAAPAGQIFLYTVRSGDSLRSIADSFDVSVNTIRWANGIADTRILKPGIQLVILPVTGVRHTVKGGDTVAAVAKRYRASIEEIIQFNGFAPDEELAVGQVLIVPSGELPEAVPINGGERSPAFASLPRYEGYYLRPIVGGRRSRGIHGYNGVDLASSCGLPVLAAADGTILITRGAGWNGGYGRYVVIAHPNSTQTLYAHLKDLAVAPGQGVRQGEVVGAIGSSGNSTGCHVHFEVRGARNPF